MTQEQRLKWIAGLALVGVLLSIYALAHKFGVTDGTVCNINDTFNCDLVNGSKYSYLFGIPVSLLGVFGYGFMSAAAVMKMRSLSDRGLTKFLLLLVAGGLTFSLYLTGIEAFVLHAWCLICVAQQVVMLGIAYLAFVFYRKEQ